jgi:hypothetical protein
MEYDSSYLSNLYPWSRDSAKMVFVDVARQPTMAAQKPKTLKLSSVIEVSNIPPTIGTSEAHMRHSNCLLQTNHCRITASHVPANHKTDAVFSDTTA